MGKLKSTRSIQLTKNTQGIIDLVCSYARNLEGGRLPTCVHSALAYVVRMTLHATSEGGSKMSQNPRT